MKRKKGTPKSKTKLSHEEFSRRGGLSRAKKLDPEQRRKIASWGGRTASENRRQQKGNGKKSGK